jgi:hypothetical protein
MAIELVDDLGPFLAQGCLIVEFIGELYIVDPAETLTFGRDADLAVDDNEFLHRKLGRFHRRDDLWWLTNIGRRIELELFDKATLARARLPPGAAVALAGAELLIQFSAGPTRYELVVQSPTSITVNPAPASDTANPRPLPWTVEQRLLMAVLAESLLRSPHLPLTLPSNEEARQRLGWEKSKFNRKLDTVCDRLATIGVRGLSRGQDRRNTERRRVLAEVAVNYGIVTEADLELIAQHCS